ncbi:hypothetical protein [Burkholderia gladioli]|uniref:hypothetical protein n=1 Tax=Burkholderia gladioli TaxID=28095 RepID=UPI001642362A|nr:hypothetical protein [Burkholderia gladioli]
MAQPNWRAITAAPCSGAIMPAIEPSAPSRAPTSRAAAAPISDQAPQSSATAGTPWPRRYQAKASRKALAAA